jgi:hypothetical protein
MKRHTPGPWRLEGRAVQGMSIAGWKNICDEVRGGSPESSEANRRLVVAAPELLAALARAIANHCPDDRFFCSSCTPARKLIARVHGE